MRYQEENVTLQLEQSRSLVSFEKEALVWDRREGEAMQRGLDPMTQGAAAYAAKQAHIWRQFSRKCQKLWVDTAQDKPEHQSSSSATKVSSFPAPGSDDDDDEDLQIVGYHGENEEED